MKQKRPPRLLKSLAACPCTSKCLYPTIFALPYLSGSEGYHLRVTFTYYHFTCQALSWPLSWPINHAGYAVMDSFPHLRSQNEVPDRPLRVSGTRFPENEGGAGKEEPGCTRDIPGSGLVGMASVIWLPKRIC